MGQHDILNRAAYSVSRAHDKGVLGRCSLIILVQANKCIFPLCAAHIQMYDYKVGRCTEDIYATPR